MSVFQQSVPRTSSLGSSPSPSALAVLYPRANLIPPLAPRTIAYMSFVVLFVMAVLYSGLFLSLSGVLDRCIGRVADHSGRKTATAAVKRSQEVRKVASKMLW
jgi:hypothetical protein